MRFVLLDRGFPGFLGVGVLLECRVDLGLGCFRFSGSGVFSVLGVFVGHVPFHAVQVFGYPQNESSVELGLSLLESSFLEWSID